MFKRSPRRHRGCCSCRTNSASGLPATTTPCADGGRRMVLDSPSITLRASWVASPKVRHPVTYYSYAAGCGRPRVRWLLDVDSEHSLVLLVRALRALPCQER